MKLWIDADAAPREMKEVVFRAAKRHSLAVVLVANQSLFVAAAWPFVESVSVSEAPDAADRYLIEHAEKGDLVVTADLALAKALVEKNVLVIDPRGEEYTPDNVGNRLSVRDLLETMRGAGVRTGGPKPYGDKEKQAFAATLDRVLTRSRKR